MKNPVEMRDDKIYSYLQSSECVIFFFFLTERDRVVKEQTMEPCCLDFNLVVPQNCHIILVKLLKFFLSLFICFFKTWISFYECEDYEVLIC